MCYVYVPQLLKTSVPVMEHRIMTEFSKLLYTLSVYREIRAVILQRNQEILLLEFQQSLT